MSALYNEIDPFAADWLRNLIAGGHIAPGDVDVRSIAELDAARLAGVVQAHFFAGIGGWSGALRDAGWPDDRPVWTGSCPCQPFSDAGKRGGFDDERHLWPTWFALIRECRPSVVFGEQVASRDGLAWFDAVHADLESAGYAVGVADLCAAGVGAPHIRQRLYFVAIRRKCVCWDVNCWHRKYGYPVLRDQHSEPLPGDDRYIRNPHWIDPAGDSCGIPNTDGLGRGSRRPGEADGDRAIEPARCGDAGGLPDADGAGREWRASLDRVAQASSRWRPGLADRGEPGPVNGFWRDADWINYTDGRARPVEAGTFPLAPRIPGRVGRLRGYGNAIVRPKAAIFVRAVMDAIGIEPRRAA